METKDIINVSTAVTRALNFLWDEIDGVYDDTLREDYLARISELEEAEKTLKKYRSNGQA